MAKGSASESLVRKATQDVRSCEAYLSQHFARPSNTEEKKAKNLALLHVRRTTAAIRYRDAAAIAIESEALSKVVVYLWALRQFRADGE